MLKILGYMAKILMLDILIVCLILVLVVVVFIVSEYLKLLFEGKENEKQ